MRTRLYRGGREELPLHKRVLLVLRYLASQETILEISDKFNVTEYTLLKYRRQVLEAVYNNMMGRIITWPTQNELPDVAQRFNDMGQYQFPGVIGAIDGTHIPIEAPRENPQAYFNRKKNSLGNFTSSFQRQFGNHRHQCWMAGSCPRCEGFKKFNCMGRWR